MMFKDRAEAGRKLAQKLLRYQGLPNTEILALPRGGIVVGFEVARALKLPLDILVTRKIGAPGNPEYAIGAIDEEGEGVWNEEEKKNAPEAYLKKTIEKERREAQRRIREYRKGFAPQNLKGKTVILVDDGIATGMTMEAAMHSAKRKGARHIVVAVPHGAKDSIEKLRREANEIFFLDAPEWYGAVGAFYETFPQVNDSEVAELLKKSTLV